MELDQHVDSVPVGLASRILNGDKNIVVPVGLASDIE
jgi:hypothetical protein